MQSMIYCCMSSIVMFTHRDHVVSRILKIQHGLYVEVRQAPNWVMDLWVVPCTGLGAG